MRHLSSELSTFTVIPMSAQIDFEALGRYIHAKERVDKLVTERHNLAAEISRLLSKATTGHGSAVQLFNHQDVKTKVHALCEANEQLEAAIAEADSFAFAAQRERIGRV